MVLSVLLKVLAFPQPAPMRRPAAEEPCPDVLSGHCCFLRQNTKNHSISSTVAKAARNLSLLFLGFPAYLCVVEMVLMGAGFNKGVWWICDGILRW